MTVKKVTHGGKYFYVDDNEFEKFFGFKHVNGDTIEIVKEASKGSHESWNIIAWKMPFGSHGRRDPKGVARDWKVGDMIISKACYLSNGLMVIL